jgi:hypothetical protein
MSGESGQALVEFALVLPVLLLVVFAIFQFGFAFNNANDETHVANELARYAIVNENPGEAQKESLAQWGKNQLLIEQNKKNSLNESAQVCIKFLKNGTSEQHVGDPVEVEVKTKTNWLPILKLEATETTIRGTAVMRLEAGPTHYGAECA